MLVLHNLWVSVSINSIVKAQACMNSCDGSKKTFENEEHEVWNVFCFSTRPSKLSHTFFAKLIALTLTRLSEVMRNAGQMPIPYCVSGLIVCVSMTYPDAVQVPMLLTKLLPSLVFVLAIVLAVLCSNDGVDLLVEATLLYVACLDMWKLRDYGHISNLDKPCKKKNFG